MAVYKPNYDLLRAQIDSIKHQSESSWICIVGIDGQDAETEREIKRIVQTDSRFVIRQFESRVGFYKNFERVMTLVPSDVDWIALADQDDVWYVHKLRLLLLNFSGVSMVAGQARIVQLNGTRDEERELLGQTARRFACVEELILDNVISGALTIFRPNLLTMALPFPSRTDVAYHDHWLGLCAALEDGIRIIPETVQDYVQHGTNVIGEELTSDFQSRSNSLFKRSGSVISAVKYFVNHRWRWRVNMCRVALERSRDLALDDVKILRAFAVDRFNLKLAALCVSALFRGNCSRLRVSSLCLASLLSPAISTEEYK